MIKVDILDDYSNDEWLKKIYIAYRRCYSNDEFENIKIPSKEKMLEFIGKFNGHKSPLEHVQITVHISGISRVLSHQLVRHRIASYSQMSQRYVNSKPNFIVPPSILKNERAYKIYLDYIDYMNTSYNSLLELEIPQEDARFVFHNGSETKIVMSMNIRSWFNFFNERCCEKAQWEIKELADIILLKFRNVFPVVFDFTGPKCTLYKRCPEVKPCGKNYIKKYEIEEHNE